MKTDTLLNNISIDLFFFFGFVFLFFPFLPIPILASHIDTTNACLIINSLVYHRNKCAIINTALPSLNFKCCPREYSTSSYFGVASLPSSQTAIRSITLTGPLGLEDLPHSEPCGRTTKHTDWLWKCKSMRYIYIFLHTDNIDLNGVLWKKSKTLNLIINENVHFKFFTQINSEESRVVPILSIAKIILSKMSVSHLSIRGHIGAFGVVLETLL